MTRLVVLTMTAIEQSIQLDLGWFHLAERCLRTA